MEEQKKKGILTRSKRKLEMDDVPIAYMEEQKKKKNENLTLGKRKIEMDGGPIASNKRWKLTAHRTATAESPHQKLPHEVIVDNILIRLPVKNLSKECALVCKLWYKSIIHPHFISLYTLFQSRRNNNRYPNLTLDILNSRFCRIRHLQQCTLRLDIDDDNDNDVYYFRKMTDLCICKQELVGHCNGLHCYRACLVHGRCFFHITNPSCRPEDFMAAMYPVPDKAIIFCCGFGFDSLANEYKIVLVYSNTSTTLTDIHDKFKCMVFTLGSISWRESSTPTTLPVIAVSAGIIQEKMKKKVILSRMSFSRSAIYVGGALYWRVLTRDQGFGDNKEEDQETEMLLCFDIHNEQFQLISLPLECSLKIKTGTTTITTEQEQQLIDHRLLEFEGSPCIARLQTGEQRNNGNCCCKVHLYVLKDRVNSEWSAEIFDVCDNTSMIQDMSNPPPCIIATATSSTTATTTTVTTTITVAAAAATTTATTTTSTTTHAPQPITQIMCASDRVILYWFDNVCVQLYDLRRKRLKMVKYSPVDPTKEVELFSCKVRRRVFLIDDVVDVDKLIYCRRDHIGYKLHSYVENSLPLKIFIPKECTILRDYMNWLLENKDIEDGLGYVYTDGKNRTPEFHCFCKRLSKEGSR